MRAVKRASSSSPGVEPERQEGPGPREYDAITVDASFGQIESVPRTAAVNSTELSCVEADCQRREALAESECRADSFCWRMGGQRLDAVRSCREGRHAGCYRGNVFCGDALTNGVSPDGRVLAAFEHLPAARFQRQLRHGSVVRLRQLRSRAPVRAVAEGSGRSRVFDDALLAQSAVDRFKNNAYDLVIEGESYRPRLRAYPGRPGRAWLISRAFRASRRPACSR